MHQCCFCGFGVEAVTPDIGSLLYTTCRDGPSEMQHDQEMFCHAKCLVARLHPTVKLYAASLAEQSADEVTGSAFMPNEG